MIDKTAVRLLKRHSHSEGEFRTVLSHSRKVRQIALELAKGIAGVDLGFVSTAALLHDIGRFKCPPWKDSVRHGIEGGKILRSEGLKRHALVAERHCGAGITKQDIISQGLDLPKRNFVPRSIEEKIITVADKLAAGARRITIEQVAERFKKEIGTRVANRIIALHKEVTGLKSGGHRSGKAEGRTAEACEKANRKG